VHFGQIILTLETGKGIGTSTVCPFSPSFFALLRSFFMLTFSTKILFSFGKPLKTLPFFPLSFPWVTKIVSPLIIFLQHL